MKKHIYALWAFFILFSQSIAASVEVRSTHMTTGDGVANNSIRYIYQDSKGFIWMGTLNGLSRYDGGFVGGFDVCCFPGEWDVCFPLFRGRVCHAGRCREFFPGFFAGTGIVARKG